MKWERIKEVDNFINYSVADFEKSIQLGYLPYYTDCNSLKVLTTDDCAVVYTEEFSTNTSFYYVHNKQFYLSINNCLYKTGFKKGDRELLCKTHESQIKLLNSHYAVASTISRRPRINRQSILKLSDCSNTYDWNSRSSLIKVLGGSIFLFQDFIDDRLSCINVETREQQWCRVFRKRIGPSRQYLYSEDRVFVQELGSSGSEVLTCLTQDIGEKIWEIKNGTGFYNFDEETCKLYGLKNRVFEAINANVGKQEVRNKLNEDLQIASHLTYYREGFLYFSGHRETNIPIFGAVDVKTGEIVFVNEVKITGDKSFRVGLEKPLVVGNRLYVRDSLKTLHIFEMV